MAVASAGPYASLHLAQADNHASGPTTQFFTGRMPFLPPNQQRQSTEGLKIKYYAVYDLFAYLAVSVRDTLYVLVCVITSEPRFVVTCSEEQVQESAILGFFSDWWWLILLILIILLLLLLICCCCCYLMHRHGDTYKGMLLP